MRVKLINRSKELRYDKGTTNRASENIIKLTRVLTEIVNARLCYSLILCSYERENLHLGILVDNRDYRLFHGQILLSIKHEVRNSWIILYQIIDDILT